MIGMVLGLLHAVCGSSIVNVIDKIYLAEKKKTANSYCKKMQSNFKILF